MTAIFDRHVGKRIRHRNLQIIVVGRCFPDTKDGDKDKAPVAALHIATKRQSDKKHEKQLSGSRLAFQMAGYIIGFLHYVLFFISSLIYSQPPTANLPMTWRLNQLEGHTFNYDDGSIMEAILHRSVRTVNFYCGFYCESNCEGQSYLFSIVIKQLHIPTNPDDAYFEPQVVWSANVNRLVSANAVLELTNEGGLVLKESDERSVVWSAGTSWGSVKGINLTDNGNLVLFDKNGMAVWQSFDHPIDTLLRGQKLRVGMKLVSGVSEPDWTEQGRFSLTLTTNGLSAIVGSEQLSYYIFQSVLSNDGYIVMINGTLALFPNGSAASEAAKVIYTNPTTYSLSYIRLDTDGHLRAHGHGDFGEPKIIGDVLPLDTCLYPEACGPYGICSNGQCTCPLPRDGINYFNPVSSQHPDLGCSPVVPLTCDDNNLRNQTFLEVKGFTYFNFAAHNLGVSSDDCKEACAKNCSCRAAFFMHLPAESEGQCSLHSDMFSLIGKDVLGGRSDNYTVYLKVQNRIDNARSTNITPSVNTMPETKRKKTFLPKTIRAGLGVAIAFSFLSSAALLLMWRKTCSNEEAEDDPVEEEVPGMPTRFSYVDLKSITEDFTQKLGEGGFGAVFRGTLRDGTAVAVKRLDGSKNMKKSFLNEVRTMGSIHHINLVKLLGFCAEKSHRLLVFEYMLNGSLDKWIFDNSRESSLEWQKRREIILDVAKGLHYLHEECKGKIIHLDIKPQNILLDENLRGKVCDFGLSKLVDREKDQVVLTAIRGTPGYLAPEWVNGLITEKVDVYSFGIVILEIILGKKVVDSSQGSEDTNLLKIFERKAEEGRLIDLVEENENGLKLDGHGVTDVLKVMRIACWCLQNNFRERPSMSMVIKALDGVMEVKDELVYDFAHPTFTRSEAPLTVLSPSLLSGPK